MLTSGTFSRGYRAVHGMGLCWVLDMRAGPLEPILREIEVALDAGLFYLAIVLAMTLPDICAALEADDGKSDRRKIQAMVSHKSRRKFFILDGR